MRNLFDIGEDLRALDDLLNEVEGDISDPIVEAAITKWFEELAVEESRKLDGWCNWIKSLEAEALTARREAEEYVRRAVARENRVERLKGRMAQYLQASGRDKIRTATGRIVRVQANGGKLPLDISDLWDAEDLPAQFQRHKVEVDTEAIRKALDAGEQLPFAQYRQRGSHLRIA